MLSIFLLLDKYQHAYFLEPNTRIAGWTITRARTLGAALFEKWSHGLTTVTVILSLQAPAGCSQKTYLL